MNIDHEFIEKYVGNEFDFLFIQILNSSACFSRGWEKNEFADIWYRTIIN